MPCRSDLLSDAGGIIYEKLQGTGATFIGTADPSDYTYDASTAEIDGQLVGLLIDENNEADKTELRIQNWTDALKKEI